MKYAHITDLHLPYFTSASLKSQALKYFTKDEYKHQPDFSSKTIIKLIRFLEYIKKQQIDFLFITGDILPTFAHAEKDQQIIESFHKILEYHDLSDKTFIVPGNHDLRVWGNFGNLIEFEYSVVCKHPYYIFLLNSCEKSIGLDDGGFSNQQVAFIYQNLKNISNAKIIILMHHPPPEIRSIKASFISTAIRYVNPKISLFYETQRNIRGNLKNWNKIFEAFIYYSVQNNLELKILCGHKHEHLMEEMTNRITVEMRDRFKSYKDFDNLVGTF